MNYKNNERYQISAELCIKCLYQINSLLSSLSKKLFDIFRTYETIRTLYTTIFTTQVPNMNGLKKYSSKPKINSDDIE